MVAYRTHRHNPPHFVSPGSTYMVTAATYRKLKYFDTEVRLRLLVESLTKGAALAGWRLDAYVVLPNHYHLLGVWQEDAMPLHSLVSGIHKATAQAVNRMDRTPGRKVWWNYWDTCITFERSYWSRVNYIHFNPVRHGYVGTPEDWPCSSYREFLAYGPEALRIERSYGFERVEVPDGF